MIVGVTDEPKSLVEKHIESKKIAYPVAILEPDEERLFDFNGFPTAFLIGPDGHIVWKGHPGNLDEEFPRDRLAALLATTAYVPPLSKEHKSIQKLLDKGEYGDAYVKIVKALEKEPDASELVDAKSRIEGLAAARLAQAQQAETAGEHGRALAGFETLETAFAGVPGAEPAAQAAEAIRDSEDETIERELSAWKDFESALATWRKGDLEKAVKAFARVGSKHEDTISGARAAEIASRHLED